MQDRPKAWHKSDRKNVPHKSDMTKCLTAEHSYEDRSPSGSITLHCEIWVMICTNHEWEHQCQLKVTTKLTWVRLPDRHQSERIMFGLQVHWHWLRQDCDSAPSDDRIIQTAWHLTDDAYLLVWRLSLDVTACCAHPQQLLEFRCLGKCNAM